MNRYEEQTEYQGIPIVIENPVGSIRSGVTNTGHKWATVFFYPYGYIENTKGADNEEIDCFIGPNPYAQFAYIVNQKVNGKFDEQKVMLGFDSEEAARDAYLSHYDTQLRLGPITTVVMGEFKELLANLNHRKLITKEGR